MQAVVQSVTISFFEFAAYKLSDLIVLVELHDSWAITGHQGRNHDHMITGFSPFDLLG